MVIPSTAHAAFHKAAHYFGVRAVVVPVGADFRADAAAMAAAIDDTTVLVVASAPSYAHGVVDPVPDIAAAAAAAGVRCHVDACIGGWVLPYAARLGRAVTPWTFAVEGVTSISVDTHKYAYAPKGTSLLLHRTLGSAAAAVLRLRRLARLHDAQPDDAVDAVRRPDRRHLGGGDRDRRRRLPAAGGRGVRGGRPDRRPWSAPSRAARRRAARLDPGHARDRRLVRPVHADRRAGRRAVGTSSRSCPTAASRRRSTCR